MFERRISLAVGVVLLGSSSLSCDGGPIDAIEVQTSPLWGDNTAMLWPFSASQGVTNIRVCFGTTFTVPQKDFIRQTVEDNWERASLINFWDWGDCPVPFPSQDVLLVGIDPTLTARTGLSGQSTNLQGTGQDGKVNGGPNVIKFNAFSGPDKSLILHEFGHALGFTHETNDDCTTQSGNATNLANQADPFSVMSQYACLPSSAFIPTKLTHWDIMGVRRTYKPKASGSITGTYGLTLNVSGGTSALGANIIGWPATTQSHGRFFRNQFALQTTSGGSTRCLKVRGGTTSPSAPTPLESTTCSPSSASQQFHFTNVQWRAMGDMCVAAENFNVTGSRLVIQECNSASLSQRWDFFENGERIRLSSTDKCANVQGGSAVLGASLELAPCQSGGSSTSDSFGFSSNRLNKGSFCVNVFGGLTTPGSRLGLWDGCGANPPLPHSQFTLSGPIHGLGNQCVQTTGTPVDGVSIGVLTCHGGANQEWEYFW